MYTEAAKTAMILSQEEQKRGNYKVARDLLFREFLLTILNFEYKSITEMHRQLVSNNLPVSSSMLDALILLHSYLIVKVRLNVL